MIFLQRNVLYLDPGPGPGPGPWTRSWNRTRTSWNSLKRFQTVLNGFSGRASDFSPSRAGWTEFCRMDRVYCRMDRFFFVRFARGVHFVAGCTETQSIPRRMDRVFHEISVHPAGNEWDDFSPSGSRMDRVSAGWTEFQPDGPNFARWTELRMDRDCKNWKKSLENHKDNHRFPREIPQIYWFFLQFLNTPENSAKPKIRWNAAGWTEI